MKDHESLRLGTKFPVFPIDSAAPELVYLIDEDRKGIVISGLKGKTGLTIKQAIAVCLELPGILEVMGYELPRNSQ
ncbi:MAG: hypothetical protein ACOYBL_13355 [Lachnospiraceae bacterium]|jgi:hypothetical protein